ncbi:MAG TPA: hypothetical protein VK742_11335 [Candidatus Sulfotelmatobacter sp.]|jgi:hypothetical protein|nr:hypothetical protein [Candidatus Sulfotelmatobacter sp.]
MKTILLLVITIVFFWRLTSEAQTIYSNAFNGGASATISGTAPTVATNLLGGSSGAQWICTTTNGVSATVFGDGTIDTNPGCALLPFTPLSGCIYFMSASVTLPTGMPNWVAMGFTGLATQTNNATGNYCRFTDNPPGGYAWMGIRANVTQGVYAGRGTALPLGNTTMIPAGTTNLTIVLNTVSSPWTVSAYLGGTIVGTNVLGGTQMGTNLTYGSNPAIAYAGIGQTSFAGQSAAGIQWNYWTLSVTQLVTSITPAGYGYWAAPAATGTGDGSTSANAAGYQNASFWNTVQSQLQNSNVTVNFLSGNYSANTMGFTNVGNPLHQLILTAVTPQGAVFNPSANPTIQFVGSQNIELNGFYFTGPVSYWAVYCIPNFLNPCRNIEINNCWFCNLTNAYYAAIGLLNGTRSVQVYNCNFTNIPFGDHAHMIYAPHDIEDVVVSNCIMQDCVSGDYIKFRDDSEYGVVKNCTFISTEASSAWPFVSQDLYNETNSDSAGDEFFGTYFQISSNKFNYQASGGAGVYSSMHFFNDSWSPQSFYCDLTSSQASALGSGSTSYQQSYLQTNMGILAASVKMFGNTYSGVTAYHMDYEYLHDDATAPYNNWTGTVNLNNAPDTSGTPLGPVPVLRNGNFDKQGMLTTPISTGDKDYQCLFRDWFCSPKYTDILSSPGFNGTTNALRFDGTTSQYVYQWITPPGPAWTLDCLFAIGSAYTGTGTKFKVDLFHNDIAGSKVSVGVNNSGQFGIYNGGTFTILSGLGTVAFSVDNNGNGNYTDPGDTLNVYRLRIVGNYNAATPSVNIYTSDANSTVLDHQALNQAHWVNGTPASGQSAPETVAFYNYTAPVVLDQVALASGLGEQAPVITNTVVGGGKVILAGTNGFAGDNCYVLSTTNLTTPAGSWTYEATNTFTGNAFSFTNTLTPGLAQKFYMLKIQ